MAAKKRWTVTMSGEKPLSEVTKHLRETGFDVDQVLDVIGCVTGTANDDVAARLRKLPGVAAVEAEPGIDIGPPDAPITW
ncbi:hypothetical protein [Hymenobacter radiodurans]|uniref:hypothetical protein n=1 Tax=Hymenobacter radiodurans TaxID=2496028 RepID=UPI0014043C23|nr:hypothetical protein [Hymenobacter radiodurans]